jgi:hypothetical protein
MSSTAVDVAQRDRGFAQWLRAWWVPLLLVVISLGYAGTATIMHTNALSPVDEWVYSDYLDKVPTEILVHEGELIGPEALNRIACDGVYPYGPMGQPCGSDYDRPSKFPFAGKTSADAYTPLYFATTWAVGGALQLLPGIDELTGWRLTSSLWLAATCVLLFFVFRKLHVAPLVTFSLALAFVVSPFSWWTYTYVSTDAPSVFFGALLLLLALRYTQGRGSGWWLTGASVLAVLFKVTNILGVCLAALFLLLTWLWELRRTNWDEGWRSSRPKIERRSLGLPLFGVFSVVFSVIAQLGWLVLRGAIAVGPPANQGISTPLGKKELLAQTTSFLPGTLTSNVVISGGGGSFALPIPSWAVAPLSWVCIAGVVGVVWTLRKRNNRAPLVVSTALASVLFAPMLAVVVALSTGTYFPLPTRYGAALLGAFLLMAAIQIKNRWATLIVLAYSACLGVAMLYLTYLLAAH